MEEKLVQLTEDQVPEQATGHESVPPTGSGPEPAPSAGDGSYTVANIEVLKNAAHVRANPGMYIGDVGPRGLHHLVYELVHNSVDEAMAGYCKNIHVKIGVDGSVSVSDDGRGIPVGVHPTEGRNTLELVMCEVGAGGKFKKDVYAMSAGLHGIGVKAVNALSEWLEVEVRRDGKVYQQDYERGLPVSEVREIGLAKRTGTRITFKPDPEIFHDLTFDFETLASRLRELAFLNKGLTIKLTDERDGREETYHYDGGIVEFVEWLNRGESTLHKPIYIHEVRDGVWVEIAFQYTQGEDERVHSYVNNVHTPLGGTHLTGFRAALTRTVNFYAGREGLVKEGLSLTGEDFREGLTAIVSVRVSHPQFESQTKVRLNNPEVEGIVTSVTNEHLSRFLEEHPQVAKKIVQRVALTAEAREAAARARKQLKERKNILNSNGLPGKLMDCTSKNRDECELFLVEGDSAGGSADGGRDRVFQAILPLRGKILNVEKARLEKMLSNDEICNIIAAVGTDIGEDQDVSKRNYERIIILTDADVDGSHIRTLLLTFFYRQMPRLIAEGHVYLAQPPLYKITEKNQVRYVQTQEEMNRELLTRGLRGARLRQLELERVFEGEQLRHLVEVLAHLEEAMRILERRGFSLSVLLSKAQQTERGWQVPQFRVVIGTQEYWFVNAAEMDAFVRAEKARRGAELEVADEVASNGQHDTIEVQELHEVKALTRNLEKLRQLGLDVDCLMPPKSIAGQEPPPRFLLESDAKTHPLLHLRELPALIRQLGEKGRTITRFKGLGEMNPEELWETTLDPARRTLLKVQLSDAMKADEMFRVLMGEHVEPRREFIEKHALEVRNLDV
ncbi:MAG: DNA gyrase subunit B [Gemmatales bacterium]|nr:DNA gyrase subunit B [Gemmatales bacterium]MDW8223420.1 DNA gyrase subunit B [Gemmatales bacterium]